jgi:hypothetical protein
METLSRGKFAHIPHFEIISNAQSTLPRGYKVDKTGKLFRQILDSEPPQWELMQVCGKQIYIRYGNLGQLSK